MAPRDKAQRAIDVFGTLFARPIPETNVPFLGMATGESLACLNFLAARGRWCRTRGRMGWIGIEWARACRYMTRRRARSPQWCDC
jgi:hypothetical protein